MDANHSKVTKLKLKIIDLQSLLTLTSDKSIEVPGTLEMAQSQIKAARDLQSYVSKVTDSMLKLVESLESQNSRPESKISNGTYSSKMLKNKKVGVVKPVKRLGKMGKSRSQPAIIDRENEGIITHEQVMAEMSDDEFDWEESIGGFYYDDYHPPGSAWTGPGF